MTTSDATLKALKEIGMTEYETSAYLALVDGGQMAASEVSGASHVPYSRIYDVLGRLEEKGFIQVIKGRPTIYRAKSPTEVVRLVRLAWDERIDNSSKVIIEELQPRFERETPVTTRDVWLLHGRAAILAKALEMLDSSREEVLLAVPSFDIATDDIDVVVDKVLTSKAKTMVLTSYVPESLYGMIPSNVEVRTRDRVFGAGLVSDKRQTLIMLAGEEDEGNYLGVYSSHAVFAAMAHSYFSSLWRDSEPL